MGSIGSALAVALVTAGCNKTMDSDINDARRVKRYGPEDAGTQGRGGGASEDLNPNFGLQKILSQTLNFAALHVPGPWKSPPPRRQDPHQKVDVQMILVILSPAIPALVQILAAKCVDKVV